MANVEGSREVNVPVRTAYDQWTQFEQFPQFMEGVEEVQQIDQKHLHWRANIAGKDKEWDAEIVDQVPDQRVAWRSLSGAPNDGVVTFEPIDNNRTRVNLSLDYEPEGFLESVGSALGFVSNRVEGDLQRFKEYIESRGTETGAWRGEIRGGQETGGSTAGMASSGTMTGAAATSDYAATSGTRSGGYTTAGETRGTAAGGAGREQSGEVRVPVVEEQINVGKRAVESGGVRVTTEVHEKPVEEQVTLRDETVNIDRQPVDRPATEADFDAARQGTIEVREHNEQAVVQKQANIVEEVVINKQAQEHTETVRDTARRTDVNVEQVPGETRTTGYRETGTTGDRTSTERRASDVDSDLNRGDV